MSFTTPEVANAEIIAAIAAAGRPITRRELLELNPDLSELPNVDNRLSRMLASGELSRVPDVKPYQYFVEARNDEQPDAQPDDQPAVPSNGRETIAPLVNDPMLAEAQFDINQHAIAARYSILEDSPATSIVAMILDMEAHYLDQITNLTNERDEWKGKYNALLMAGRAFAQEFGQQVPLDQ